MAVSTLELRSLQSLVIDRRNRKRSWIQPEPLYLFGFWSKNKVESESSTARCCSTALAFLAIRVRSEQVGSRPRAKLLLVIGFSTGCRRSKRSRAPRCSWLAQVTWAVRKSAVEPYDRIKDDPLSERDSLLIEANYLSQSTRLRFCPNAIV